MPTFKLSPTKKLILWHDILSSHNMLILINPFAVLNPYSLTNELKDSNINISFHPLKDASKIQIQSWSTRWIYWQKMPPNQYWWLWYFYRQNRSSQPAQAHEFYYDSQNRTKMETENATTCTQFMKISIFVDTWERKHSIIMECMN